MTLEIYNAGVDMTSTQEYADLSAGWYRIVSGGSDVTVQTKIAGGTLYTIGTVSTGEAEDVYLDEGDTLKCTFAGSATVKRLMGRK